MLEREWIILAKILSDWKISRTEGAFSVFESPTEKIVVQGGDTVVASVFKSNSICPTPDDVVLKTKECTFVICPQSKEIRVYTNKE